MDSRHLSKVKPLPGVRINCSSSTSVASQLGTYKLSILKNDSNQLANTTEIASIACLSPSTNVPYFCHKWPYLQVLFPIFPLSYGVLILTYFSGLSTCASSDILFSILIFIVGAAVIIFVRVLLCYHATPASGCDGHGCIGGASVPLLDEIPGGPHKYKTMDDSNRLLRWSMVDGPVLDRSADARHFPSCSGGSAAKIGADGHLVKGGHVENLIFPVLDM